MTRTRRAEFMPAVIDADTCAKCQACVEVCPKECIAGEADTLPIIDTDECIDCGACESECPSEAITLE
jgi:NAD-dependent dihydropyrimidine dehydrogenase PreA subunit